MPSDEPNPEPRLYSVLDDATWPGTLEVLEGGGQKALFYSADETLTAEANFGVEVGDDVYRFLTGLDEDTSPPTGGQLTALQAYHHEGPCTSGPQLSLLAEMTLGADDGGLTLYELELTREDGAIERLVTLRSVVYLGEGDCVENLPLTPGERLSARSRALDYAGGTSAWSEPIEARVPRRACAAAPEAPPVLGAALVLAALTRRRRSPR
ncbi:hypothetical protein L6R49_03865 [Myxococcota bacterium]|nr:hypothetical protein [Myxococcota bacterium]